MTPATQTTAPQDELSDEEVEAMLEAVRSVRYASDLLSGEWVRTDLTVVGIAKRVVDLALPLFENECAEDDLNARGFLFYANPRVSLEAFVTALNLAALPRVIAIMTDIESHMAADMHASGYTDLAWPMDPRHGVLSEEAARARYLDALENEISHPGFGGFLREYLMLAMMSPEIARKG